MIRNGAKNKNTLNVYNLKGRRGNFLTVMNNLSIPRENKKVTTT